MRYREKTMNSSPQEPSAPSPHTASDTPAESPPSDGGRGELRELALLFARLGCTAFGGPVAHIAMMQDEVVERRAWLTRQKFLDLVGATNLIPGPNSTELAMHIGALRGGVPGLMVAGLCFILPAVFIVLAIAVLYAHYGWLPAAQGLLRGVQPVVVAIVAHALYKFSGTAIKNRWTAFLALIAFALVFVPRFLGASLSEISIIVLAAAVGLGAGFYLRARGTQVPASPPASLNEDDMEPPNHSTGKMGGFLMMGLPGVGFTTVAPTIAGLFWGFLKIGSVLYGSGYVLIAFLRADFVERLGWLTDRQLLDAVAVGQFTPGPVFTTATFIGYQIAGVGGALAATVGIFLPSFVFVGLLSPLLERLEGSPVLRGFLDAVNAASFALIAAVTLELAQGAVLPTLGQTALVPMAARVWPLLLFGITLGCLLRTRVNSAWLIAGGALVGILFR
jgi:chromate transporter